MFLWATAVSLTLLLLVLLAMIWIRKVQFDTIQRNFLDLEAELGGRVLRAGFAVRPSFSGEFNGQKIHISITSEGRHNERKYYIAVTMQAKPRISFAIKSTSWLEKREIPPDQDDKIVSLQKGQYLLETTTRANLKKLKIPQVESIISGIHPFAYILIGPSGMLLERTSINLVEDTKIDPMRKLIETMYLLKKLIE